MNPNEFMYIREREALTHRFYASLGAIVMYCLENHIEIDFRPFYADEDNIEVTVLKGVVPVQGFLLKKQTLVTHELVFKLYQALSKLEDDYEQYEKRYGSCGL